MKTSVINYFFIVLTIIIWGCAKDGEQGPAGPAGQDGNANVHSYSYTVTPGMWQSSASTGNKFVEISISELTQEIVDEGLVMVYLQEEGYSAPLPFTMYVNDNPLSFLVSYTVGILEIDLASTVPINAPNVNFQFKVIIVPSSPVLSNPNINWKNYEEVKQSLNL